MVSHCLHILPVPSIQLLWSKRVKGLRRRSCPQQTHVHVTEVRAAWGRGTREWVAEGICERAKAKRKERSEHQQIEKQVGQSKSWMFSMDSFFSQHHYKVHHVCSFTAQCFRSLAFYFSPTSPILFSLFGITEAVCELLSAALVSSRQLSPEVTPDFLLGC